MRLTSGLLGDVPMFALEGALGETTCGALETALKQLLDARHNIVFLDLTDVTRIDRAGLSVLLDWVQALGGKGWMGLIAPSVDVRSFLEREGFLTHPNVRLFDTRQAARVATGERQST